MTVAESLSKLKVSEDPESVAQEASEPENSEVQNALELKTTIQEIGLVNGLQERHIKCLNELRIFIKVHALNCKELGMEQSNFRLSDATLLRFLQARDFDPKKAGQFLKSHLVWRDKYIPSQIEKKNIKPNLMSSGIYRFLGKTLEGHQVIQFQLGLLDPAMADLEEYIRYVIFVLEESVRRMKDHFKNVWIFDLEGWGVLTHGTPKGMEFTKQVLTLAQSHYPERLRMALIVRAPWLFQTTWRAIKSWLDPKTEAKVKFLSSRKEMHKYIDPGTLPKCYYGTHDDYPAEL